MSSCTDLEHVHRSRRLLGILVDRFGVAHFLSAESSGPGRVNDQACEAAVSLACTWIERRTGRPVDGGVTQMMRRHLRKLLVERIREGAACIR